MKKNTDPPNTIAQHDLFTEFSKSDNVSANGDFVHRT